MIFARGKYSKIAREFFMDFENQEPNKPLIESPPRGSAE